MKSARVLLTTATLVLASAAPASAVELTKQRARSEINQVFRQELAWADGTVVSAGLSSCRRRSTRTVDCRSVATIASGSGRDRCSKVYRARRTSSASVRVTQSRTGSGFTSYVSSRCRSL